MNKPPVDITYNPYAQTIPGSTRSRTAARRIASSGGGTVGQKSYANHRESDTQIKRVASAAIKKMIGK